MDSVWGTIKEIICKSKSEIIIFEGSIENGKNECEKLNIPCNSVLASVVINCNGIYIDNWIRILGQGNEKQNGIMYYNTIIDDSCLDGMFIVANDVLGGIYAINLSRYVIEKNMIWYFAPDTLEWESIGMKYFDFIAWTAQNNVNEFYESMRWNNWRKDCKDVEFNKGYLIYPFLWAKECDINNASKKIVLFDELMNLNFDFSKKLL